MFLGSDDMVGSKGPPTLLFTLPFLRAFNFLLHLYHNWSGQPGTGFCKWRWYNKDMGAGFYTLIYLSKWWFRYATLEEKENKWDDCQECIVIILGVGNGNGFVKLLLLLLFHQVAELFKTYMSKRLYKNVESTEVSGGLVELSISSSLKSLKVHWSIS